MKKILLKLLFAALFFSVASIQSQITVEVESGTVAGGDAGTGVIGSENGGTNNVRTNVRKSSGAEITITNSVTIPTTANYDFTLTYYKGGASGETNDNTLEFSADGVLKFTHELKKNASPDGSATTASYGTVTISNINLDAGTYNIELRAKDPKAFNIDNYIISESPPSPLMTAIKDGDWDDPTTWAVSGAVANTPSTTPTAEYDVIIGNFTITVPPGIAGECNNLEIDGTTSARIIQIKETGSLTVNGNLTSDRSNDGIRLNYSTSPSTRDLGSIIITGYTSSNGTSAGSRKAFITKRLPSNDDWHLISIGGTDANKSDVLGSSNIVTNVDGEYSMASYNGDNAVDSKYVYFTTAAGTSGTFDDMGYSIKVNNTGNAAEPDITLKPKVAYQDFNETISDAGDGFNLVGNPFLAYVNVNTAASTAEGTAVVGGSSTNLLAENVGVLEEQTIWLWNNAKSGGAGWEIVNLGDSDYRIHPIQGFFVKAKSGGGTSQTLAFKETMLSHSKASNNFLKTASSRSEIDLSIASGKRSTSTAVRYIDGTTTSFDNGYDSSTFGGYSSSFEVYTNLLDGDVSKKLAIQSLPNSDYENFVVPVGVTAEENSQIIFTIDAKNIPTGYNVYLEDRLNNRFTKLNEANAKYVATVSEKSTEGRFYLHTKTSSVLSTVTELLNSVSIYKSNATTLRIVGLSQGKTNVSLYNVLGKQVLSTSFSANGVKEISLPKLSKGVYIVQLETETGKLNKKIVLE